MLRLTLAALTAALLSTGGPARADHRRGNGSCAATGQHRGGPLRNLVGGVADRIHDRIEARQLARGVRSPAEAFPAPATVAAPAEVVSGGTAACVGGNCTAAPVSVRRGLFGR